MPVKINEYFFQILSRIQTWSKMVIIQIYFAHKQFYMIKNSSIELPMTPKDQRKKADPETIQRTFFYLTRHYNLLLIEIKLKLRKNKKGQRGLKERDCLFLSVRLDLTNKPLFILISLCCVPD